MYINTKRFGKSVLCIIGTIIILLAGFLPAVSAASENGSLVLICSNEDIPYKNVQWSLYKAAERQSNGKLALYGDFANYAVSLEDESTSAMQDAADTLENYAVLDNLSPISVKYTNEDGKLVFDGIDNGVYLICGKSWIEGNKRYIPSPMLIEFSEKSEKNLIAYPKFQIQNISDSDVKYTVRKIWKGDDKSITDRPEDVKIEIYKDGVLKETVILNESNNWEYSWTSEPQAQWRVKETIVASKYTVVYRFRETLYLVENNHFSINGGGDNRRDTGTGGSGNGRLPQTGQLWWPVPALAFGGLILISVGCRINKRKGK